MESDDDYVVLSSHEEYLVNSKSTVPLSLLLCSWDNVEGPKILASWHIKTSRLENDILRTVASLTLSSELSFEVPPTLIKSKYYLLNEQQVCIYAMVFSVESSQRCAGNGIHSLSFILSSRSICLQWIQSVPFDEYLRFIVRSLRVHIKTNLNHYSALGYLSSEFKQFVRYFEDLLDNACTKVEIEDTFLHSDRPPEVTFLRRAIASHLMTSSRTVVIGKTEEKINLMVRTLAVFSSDDEINATCRLAIPYSNYGFCPFLAIQGIICEEPKLEVIDLKLVLRSSYPLTVVNMATREVYQTPLIHEQRPKAWQFWKQSVQTLWLDGAPHDPGCATEYFLPFENPDNLVLCFLSEVSLLRVLPAANIPIYNYVKHFLMLLNKKAKSLIMHAEALRKMDPSCIISTEVLRKDLSIPTESDFFIILSRAERFYKDFDTLVFHSSQSYST